LDFGLPIFDCRSEIEISAGLFYSSRLSSTASRLTHAFRLTAHAYLITLSGLASTFGGIVRPICFAALRLVVNRECRQPTHGANGLTKADPAINLQA
jgi:hypothetical protein